MAGSSDLERGGAVRDLLDPRQVAADPGVDAGRGRVAAAVTPGYDAGEHPALALGLAHQRAAAVALATVGAVAVGEGAGTEHAVAGVALAVALLALTAGEQRDPSLLEEGGLLRV